MNIKMLKMAFAGLVLTVSGFANAAIIYGFSGGNITSGQLFTYGFQFTALDNITIDSLGFYDYGSNGLASTHRAGIWSLNGDLLTSVTITNDNSTLQGRIINNGQFRFAQISDFNILSAESYVFGVAIEQATDSWFFGGENISLAPSLVNVESTGSFKAGNFVFPSGNIGNRYHAGSFTARLTEVPEPSSIAIFALGLMGLASRRFMKKS
ncbi:PEP-CTERM sorting domain-containing protein [Paraglaciecola sp. 25GB23A]|uniref:PEP-CTERM sorting domain-containing protein n=1 Tax=Paraglaciecola sp. 25GB23A TaxID=3156068 RepID=UPI0032AFAA61